MIKKHFLEILRWGLRLHGISHFIEVLSAIAEEAYVTASIALFFIFIVLDDRIVSKRYGRFFRDVIPTPMSIFHNVHELLF
jgi:hypothetical protein|tara:strand:+ start:110 stop:352 length:243 start_codon:yes stop_codon:yes gene_type:complete